MERTPVSFGPGVFLFYGGFMADKVFKTHEELITLLKSRGVDISTSLQKSYAKKVLQREGYYNLINGYNILFLSSKDPDDTYKSGTTMDQIYALYSFDRKLRNIFLKYILQVETNVKSLIAYNFPKKYSHNNYLLYNNFDTTKKGSTKHIPELISDIQRQIATRASDPSISHYLTNYGYIPIWVLNNILTLGTISKFYSLMKQPDKQSVSKVFHISDTELESALFYLSKIRNICAHGNRLYCFRNRTPFIDTDIHANIGIPKTNGEYAYGKRDLFAAMIILKRLLPKNDYNTFIKLINKYIFDLSTKLKILTETDILNSMGFPTDWRTQLQKK